MIEQVAAPISIEQKAGDSSLGSGQPQATKVNREASKIIKLNQTNPSARNHS